MFDRSLSLSTAASDLPATSCGPHLHLSIPVLFLFTLSVVVIKFIGVCSFVLRLIGEKELLLAAEDAEWQER